MMSKRIVLLIFFNVVISSVAYCYRNVQHKFVSHSNIKVPLFSSRLPITAVSDRSKEESVHDVYGRRMILSKGVASFFVVGGFVSGNALPEISFASVDDSALFRKNPLLNPVLEQIRIWEQAEADNIRYGGELEKGDAGNKGKVDAYPKLLVPILQIAYDIDRINNLIVPEGEDRSTYYEALQILNQPKYQKIPFKRIFNAYADNIYYSDPDRANLYLAGGATPKTEQSLAYLLRNEILTNIENLQAELEYVLKNPSEPVTDLRVYASDANVAMERYLEIAPPNELRQAKLLLNMSTQ